MRTDKETSSLLHQFLPNEGGATEQQPQRRSQAATASSRTVGASSSRAAMYGSAQEVTNEALKTNERKEEGEKEEKKKKKDKKAEFGRGKSLWVCMVLQNPFFQGKENKDLSRTDDCEQLFVARYLERHRSSSHAGASPSSPKQQQVRPQSGRVEEELTKEQESETTTAPAAFSPPLFDDDDLVVKYFSSSSSACSSNSDSGDSWADVADELATDLGVDEQPQIDDAALVSSAQGGGSGGFESPVDSEHKLEADGSSKVKKNRKKTPTKRYTKNQSVASYERKNNSITAKNLSRKNAPTNAQKIIDILLRLECRGLNVYPPDMLERCCDANNSNNNTMSNSSSAGSSSSDFSPPFMGYRLKRKSLLTSPDEDEIYVCVHAERDAQLEFAARQDITMVTNPYSFAGGTGLPYSREAEQQLAHSVESVATMQTDGDNELQIPEQFYSPSKGAQGYIFEVPQKMRLTIRMLREAWGSGGCGVQVDEMLRKKALIRHFFPLHNSDYIRAYDLDRWASLRPLVSLTPLYQKPHALVLYLGEKVALYFVWLRQYTLFLRFPALVGVVFGVLAAADVLRTSTAYGINAVFVVIWSFLWLSRWDCVESQFVTQYGQEIEIEQQLARDEFRPESTKPVEPAHIYNLDFTLPVTLTRRSDGTLMELVYSENKRTFTRVLITYPFVIFLTILMVAAFYYVTYWRFEHISNGLVTHMSSVLIAVIAAIFGKVFDETIHFLNSLENNRTDGEEEQQLIVKSYAFYFVNAYFALFAIIFWPNEGGKPVERLIQLKSQMIVILLIQPMVQNIQELLLPFLASQLRLRNDHTESRGVALWTMLRCMSLTKVKKHYRGKKKEKETEKEETAVPISGKNHDDDDDDEHHRHAEAIWLQVQKEPYKTTAQDYLEITIQFGYMCMFAAVFPWGPAAALFYNALELRIDAIKIMYHSQRPTAAACIGIGPWRYIFVALCVVSLVTNSYFVFILSPMARRMRLPQEEEKWMHFAGAQYIMAFVCLVGCLVMGSTPEAVSKERVKQRLLKDKSVREKLFSMIEEHKRKKYNK